MSTNKRIAKRLLSAVLTMLMLMSMVTIGMASASAATVELSETGVNLSGGEVFYLMPSSNWQSDGARFAMFLCNGTSGDAWIDMTKVDDSTQTVYTATAPAGDYVNIIFVRMNPAATANNWDNKWNQTSDLTYDGTNNCFTIPAGTWDYATTSWSTYTPPVSVTKYDVTFNEGNFTVTGEATVEEGNDYTFTVEPASDYEITSVICNDAELTAVDGTYTVENVTADLNIVITATEIVKYTVMFVDYDNTILLNQTVEAGTEVKIPDDPTRAGYLFTGWSPVPEVTTDDETGKWITVNATAVYTAQYQEDSNDTPIITVPVDTTQAEEEETAKHTVMFVDYDNTLLKIAKVEDGQAAEAPEEPARTGYTFTGWSQSFDNVTADLLVVAQYEKNASTVVTPTHGKLQVEVAGGTGFTIAVDGGTARPQGTSYLNTKMPIGTSVTLVAASSNDNEFIGWMNNAGVIVSTTDTYTFITAGNDYVKAMYITDVESVNLVIYKNDKAAGGNGQILDMQYYATGDEIVVPDDAAQAGYTFTGWSMSVDDIQTELVAGNDVVVTPIFEVRKYYVAIEVTNGSVTANGGTSDDGKYLAYKGTTVTADAAPEGQKFAYWTDGTNIKSYKSEYKFYPAGDISLTAVYVAEDEVVEEVLLADIAADSTVDGNNITFITSWYVPESIGTFEAGGILVVEASNYNESTFVVGGGDSNVTQAKPSKAQYADQPGTALTKQNVCYAGTTWYGVTWVQYTDADGELQTVYSDMIEVTKY